MFAIPALFVGNEACSGCHQEIYRSYTSTPMAMSSGSELPALTPGAFRHAASKVSYEIDANGLVRFSKGDKSGERQLNYYIGSAVAGRSFGYLRDGFLFEAPVTWYTQTGAWDVSPGYASDTASRWSRPIEPSCLFCHASQARPRQGTVNAYAGKAFEHNGITCERCHGPGSLHADGKGKLVNPAKLEPARRDAVCAQCHLTGQARIVRAGRQVEEYRPGDLLSDFAAYFVLMEQGAFQVNSHVEKLAASACKRASGDKLWCGSCHDPHSLPAASEKAAYFRARCLACHKPEHCQRGPDCAGCHMPRNPAADAGHGVFTDHSIPRKPKAQSKRGASWKLKGFSAADTGDRELGLAYAEKGVRTGNAKQLSEAVRLLAASPRDAEVLVRLASLEQRAGNIEKAVTLYRSALKQDPNSIVALVNLGGIYGSAGHLDEAATLWRAALKKNPCQAEAGTNLQVVLREKNEINGAEVIRRSQEFCLFQ